MERSFKGVWIPKEIWLDESLGWSEKLLLVEISSLDNEEGCWATNEYFAEFFNLSKDRISKLISSLKNKGYLTVELVYKKGTRKIDRRIVKITDRYRYKNLEGVGENNDTPIGENTEDNNTVINNTKNNTKKEISSQIENLRQRYSQSQLKVIDDYLEMIRHTRVSAKISESVVLGMYKDWDKHPQICVEYGLRTHTENPSYHSRKENYTLGIIRNTTADEAFSKLNQKGGNQVASNGTNYEGYNFERERELNF